MLILSTFISDYLHSPLQFLLEKFLPQPINIKYVNTNLIGELSSLNLIESKSYAILLRLFDFIEKNSILSEDNLKKHLNLIVNQIIVLKQKNTLPFLIFICPSPKKFLNEKIKKIEELFIRKLHENKIHTLTLADAQEKYSVFEFENPIEDDTHIPYTPEFYTAIACLLARKLHAITQKPYKLIAVDCDNTLWTGVAADDGIENIVFEDQNILLQNYLVEQQKNGKIICLCSKNEEQTILDAFNHHETVMPLKLKHLSNNKINWKLKSENIKKLALELNIFPDSFRFIDDNPTEIKDVSQIPGVFCITMPQNTVAYKNHWAFDFDEYSVVTEADKNRTEFYAQAEIKAALATRFNDPVEYLRSSELGQSITISKINSKECDHTIERVSQLSGKTNQFNLFPESKAKEKDEIKSIVNNTEREIFIGRIKDNFSSEDITAVAISSLGENNLTIDSFFVSCRAFRRGLEYEMLKHIAQFSQERSLKFINLKFKKSKKNNAAGDFLNVLSEETNKDPISRFLLNKTKGHAWIHDNLKFLFKKLNLCLDFSSLACDEESILTLSSRELIDLELDSLIRTSLNFSKHIEKQQLNLLIKDNNKMGEENLIELSKVTSSLDYLLSKFFIDNNAIKSIPKSENIISEICIKLLGKEGQNESLIARGLDSIKATELRYYLYQKYGVNVAIQKLLCEKTTVLNLIEFIDEQNIYQEKIAQNVIEKNDNFYNINLPSSLQQKSIWLAEQQEPVNNSANHLIIACYKITSDKINISDYKKACYEFVNSHDVFDASFSMENKELGYSPKSPGKRDLHFQYTNLDRNTKISLAEAIQQEIDKPCTMSTPPRFNVFTSGIFSYLLFMFHHGNSDATSLKNSIDSISNIYNSRLSNNPPQYSEYILDQQKKLRDEAYQAEAYSFWKDTLSKVEAVTMLPYDKPLATFKLPTEQVNRRYEFSLFSNDLRELKKLAHSNYKTCFTVLNTVFALLVASYTFQRNITLITVINGRDEHPSYDKTIGNFVRPLVLPFNLEAHQPFNEYLETVNKNFLDSQEFQNFPFDKIQEILSEQNIKEILFSPAFIYQNYSISKPEFGGERAELVYPKNPTIFDVRKTCRFGNFTMFAGDFTPESPGKDDEKLEFIIEYAQDLFSLTFIERFAKNYIHTIKNVCNNPKQKLQDISVVCDKEQSELISFGQGPKFNYTQNDNLIRKFQQTVEKYPNNLALGCGKIQLNYQEVDQQSTNLALALLKTGVQRGQHVGIFLEANHLFFIAELAILKVGAVFIPLSKDDPYDRLKSIIEDAKINFFIVDGNTKGLFATDFKTCQLTSINSVKIQHATESLPLLTSTMEDNACILYTSGSTGKPKGVILTQKSIFRVVVSLSDMITPQDKIAQTANQAFDAAQLEFFLAFTNAANLIIFDKNILLNKNLFTKELSEQNISVMWLTAGLFNLYALNSPEIFIKLKFLMSGGDVVDKKAVEQVLDSNPNLKFINGYGPTETGIFALTYISSNENLNKFSTVPIGKPTIAGTQIFILNVFNSLAPLGAIGQLAIAGDGLGTYHNNENLNKKCFLLFPKKIHDFFLNFRKKIPPHYIYLSGDKVQYRNNEILFLNRMNDNQIKIRGNLVSLAEIKSALEEYPAIIQAEIIYKQVPRSKSKLLVVFYTKNRACLDPKKQELIQFLSTKLPQTMIPIWYEQISQFRLTANGKLDRADLFTLPLTAFEENDDDQENIHENLNKFQEILISIFKDILSFSPSLDSDFFDMGGNSIEAIQLLAKIEEDFGKRISFNSLRQNSTVRSLSRILERDEDPEKNLLPLLYVGKDEKLPPIIFIHPAGGGLFCFNKLIEALKQVNLSNYCYGIEDPVILEREVKTLTIPQMARNYLKCIREKIKGPFILAGYSFGGMVALEIAAQLEIEALHQNCLGVILLDTWVVSCADEELKETLRSHVLEYCEKIIKNVSANPKIETVENIIIPMMDQCKYYQQIGFQFKPKKLYSTSVHLFKARYTDKFEEMEKKTQYNYLENYVKPENLRKLMVEGNHFTLLEESVNLASLAENLVNYIEKTCQKVPNVFTRPSTFFPTPSQQDVMQKSNILVKQVFALRN